jgi:hypothetical protein
MNPRIDSLSPMMKTPDRDDHVDRAEPECVLAGGGAKQEQPERAGGDVDDVVPGVDVEDAEDGVDVARRSEGGGVGEADDAGDQEDGADDERVQRRRRPRARGLFGR